jgi:dihydrofolate reductase
MYELIVAFNNNYIIGNDLIIPWNIKEDLKYFKQQTEHKNVIMGYKTHLTFPALKNRKNYVIVNNDIYEKKDGFIYVKEIPDSGVFIGGASIYKKYWHLCKKIYITLIDNNIKGNVYFPIPLSEIEKKYNIISNCSDVYFDVLNKTYTRCIFLVYASAHFPDAATSGSVSDFTVTSSS